LQHPSFGEETQQMRDYKSLSKRSSGCG
jgi:hypothetical protein